MNFTKTLLFTLCITATTASFSADNTVTPAQAQEQKTQTLQQQASVVIGEALVNFFKKPRNYFILGSTVAFVHALCAKDTNDFINAAIAGASCLLGCDNSGRDPQASLLESMAERSRDTALAAVTLVATKKLFHVISR